MLSFKEFEHYMNDIVKHVKLTEEVDDLCRKYNTDRYISYPTLDYDVVSLLAKLMDDEECEWIDYWVFELHCGEQYHDGAITYDDGTIVKMKTVKDLYDLLVENQKKVKIPPLNY